MRRLPIIFLLDTSESMAGEHLYQLEEGLGAIVSTLRRDPHALETASLSVIIFAGKPRTLSPLTELVSFRPPELPIGGGTALGAALDHLMREIDEQVVLTTPNRKGDWKPIIFLLTDGHPTDDPMPAIERWNASFRSRANLVAISIGGTADHAVLQRLTNDVIVFNDAAPDAFARFVTWMTMSIQSQSRSIHAGNDGKVNLAKEEPGLVESLAPAIERASSAVDDRYAVFVGKCRSGSRPYLVKYERQPAPVATSDPALGRLFPNRHYTLSLAMPLKQSYFDLSAGARSGQTVEAGELSGQPPCPHCNATYSMAVCGCGGIHCINEGTEHRCPWCGNIGLYGPAANGELSIDRGRG